MRNSDLFYSKAAEFQSKRKAVMDTYEKTIAGLERARGSQLYTEETQKAAQARDTALKALRDEYRGSFSTALGAMAAENDKRGETPPTAEQLSILQALKMRDKVTRADLDRAANSCKNNPLAISVLNELSQKCGIFHVYRAETGEMGVEDTAQAINSLRRSVNDFMEHDTQKAARIAANYYETVYGNTGNGRNLPKRPLFSDKEGCFNTLLGMDKATCAAFCAAVDGDGAADN